MCIRDRDRATSLPYITLFGLDSLDVNGSRQYDEIIDVQSGNIINMLNGELLIPMLHPFAVHDSLEGGNRVAELEGQLGTGKMYTSSISSEINFRDKPSENWVTTCLNTSYGEGDSANNFQRIFDAQIIDGKIKKAYLYQRDISDREIK